MRSRKPYLRLCAALLALLLCWGGALSRAQWLTREYTGASVRLTGGGLPAETLKAMLAQGGANAPRLAAWTRSGQDITLENRPLGTQARARRIAVFGDMAQVCPMTLIFGSLPPSVDEDGCVIDEAVAEGLFRNVDVVGAAIELGGQSYTVRAVVSAREPMILLRDGAAEYENLELIFSEVERAGARAEELLYSCDVAKGRVIVENGFYARLLSGLAQLPGLLLAAAILATMLRQIIKRRTIPLQLALLVMVTAAVFFLLKWLLKLEVYWPDSFLPTRWSDFEFWAELAQKQRNYFGELSFLLPVPKDMLWRASARGLLGCAAGAALAMAYLLARGKTIVGALSTSALLCVAGCLAAATGALHLSGSLFMPSSGFLYGLPLWWLFESRSALQKELRCYGPEPA